MSKRILNIKPSAALMGLLLLGGTLLPLQAQEAESSQKEPLALGITAGVFITDSLDLYFAELTNRENTTLSRGDNNLGLGIMGGVKWAHLYAGIEFFMSGSQTIKDTLMNRTTAVQDYHNTDLFVGILGTWPHLPLLGGIISPALGTEFGVTVERDSQGTDLPTGYEEVMDLWVTLGGHYVRPFKTCPWPGTPHFWRGGTFFPTPHS